jgi:shikimate kinase
MNNCDRNIVLIGMPGCGKTTIGRMLANELGKKLIDIDSYIEKQAGCTISRIFEQGEQLFRRLETEAIYALENERASVITTGGGIIKNASNMESLHKHGIIVYIDRNIKDIANDININTRPLLAKGTQQLAQLYAERHGLYVKYSDFTVKNEGQITEVMKNIIKLLNEKTLGGI